LFIENQASFSLAVKACSVLYPKKNFLLSQKISTAQIYPKKIFVGLLIARRLFISKTKVTPAYHAKYLCRLDLALAIRFNYAEIRFDYGIAGRLDRFWRGWLWFDLSGAPDKKLKGQAVKILDLLKNDRGRLISKSNKRFAWSGLTFGEIWCPGFGLIWLADKKHIASWPWFWSMIQIRLLACLARQTSQKRLFATFFRHKRDISRRQAKMKPSLWFLI
jgi:hypothetical protein